MQTVLAAVDNSLATNPVLVTARALARVFGVGVRAIHVATNAEGSPGKTAEAVGVPLRVASGPVVERLIEAGRADDVVAMVIGARARPSDPRPLGSTAFAVATGLPKPIVVVPPSGRIAPALRRVLVPLEGTVSTSLAPRSVIELGGAAALEITVLHVGDEGDDPPAAADFLADYCPWGIDHVQFVHRGGAREELVPLVAEEREADMIALGWTQQLEHGRAPVVRAALERSRVPVMLVPVQVAADLEEGALR